MKNHKNYIKLFFGLLFVLYFTSASFALEKLNQNWSIEKKYLFFKNCFEILMQENDLNRSLEKIENLIPNFKKNLKNAIKISNTRWARSVNWDEFEKKEILPEKILKVFNLPYEITDGEMHVSAGVMHTYGYMFSQLQTRFGLKSKRWIESRIDERLGFQKNFFSINPNKGEFLENLTFALDTIIECSQKKCKDFVPLTATIKEEVEWEYKNQKTKKTIFTYFFKLKELKDFNSNDTHLLVYVVKDNLNSKFLYVTTFPVGQAFLDSTIQDLSKINVNTFKPRYNYYIPKNAKFISYSSQVIK
jgi:hypothetical protein